MKSETKLKKIPPYWHAYQTNVKGRWFDREILEVVSTEFRDRSVEYYRYALESGVTTINGKVVKPGYIIRNGDYLENMVHRHEPPVTSTPVRILLEDEERQFIVIDKPGSIPVHATGRYFKNSLVEILKDDFGYKKVHTVNRLDRLTSGLMIIATSADRARLLTEEFTEGRIKKEYIARVQGEFPAEEVTVDQPLLTVDRQMGLNIIHPEGKHAKTIFARLFYDAGTNTSVVHCRPLTGRSHQIRVHLQYLGYPIANDPVYSDRRVWVNRHHYERHAAALMRCTGQGPKCGKGGIDITPGEERFAPAPPPQHEDSPAEGRQPGSSDTGKRKPKQIHRNNPAWRTKAESRALVKQVQEELDEHGVDRPLPRETGHDIGMGSPVPLSLEAVRVITKLRNQKDQDEDWSRWRDVIFRAKGQLKPHPVTQAGELGNDTTPKPTDRNEAEASLSQSDTADSAAEVCITTEDISKLHISTPPNDLSSQLADPTAEQQVLGEPIESTESTSTESLTYCPECYLPLHPDPFPEKLYIFLHALRYTTSFGSFETTMPDWAAPGWEWNREGDEGTNSSANADPAAPAHGETDANVNPQEDREAVVAT